MTRRFLIPQPDNIVIAVDFGQGEDFAVKTVFRRQDNGFFMFLSSEFIGRAKDFDTEEKIVKYIETL